MVNGVKNIPKFNVCKVNVIIRELSVFQDNNVYLYLSRGVSLSTKPFLAKVQYFVFFTVACKEGREGIYVEFVDSVSKDYGSIIIKQ